MVEFKPPEKKFVAQIGAEMIFSILMSSSFHSNVFVLENCFKVFGLNDTRNRPRMKFFEFCEKSMHGTFQIFCLKLKQR